MSSGCFSVEFGEDQVACGAGDACPPGLACSADGFCRQPGSVADAAPDAAIADAPVAPPDAVLDAAVLDAAGQSDARILSFSFQDGVLPQADYQGTRDSVIREASPMANYGSETTLVVDGEAATDGNSHDERALVRWDLSVIPADSTVEAATITVQIVNESNDLYPLYPLRRPWAEAEVTWERASDAEAWAAAGADGVGDRDTTAIGVATGLVGPLSIELDAEGLQVVEQWIADPSSNHGVIIFDTAATNGLDFYSRDHGTPAARPRLDVTVRAP